MEKIEILNSHGVNIIQHLQKGDVIEHERVTFEGDDLECLRVLQIANKEGLPVLKCYKEYSIIDGIIEKPYGIVTFL